VPGNGADCQRCAIPDSATDHESGKLPCVNCQVVVALAHFP
jgi:transcription initiation factor TFIIIB Brf1 subunit/transcription initiation factor TFIIB